MYRIVCWRKGRWEGAEFVVTVDVFFILLLSAVLAGALQSLAVQHGKILKIIGNFVVSQHTA